MRRLKLVCFHYNILSINYIVVAKLDCRFATFNNIHRSLSVNTLTTDSTESALTCIFGIVKI